MLLKPRTHRRITPNDPSLTIIRYKDLRAKVSLSRHTVNKLMSQGEFPKSVRIGERSIGWILSEVDAWVKQCKIMRLL